MERTARIRRPEYLRKLAAYKETDLIKIVTGVRRCGKSTLLELFARELRERGASDDQLLFLNLEDLEHHRLREPETLHAYVLENLASSGKTYVCIDEVQLCQDFPDVLGSLRLRSNIDLYVTGSNASVLPADLAARAADQYVHIPMFPLSFREFVEATNSWEHLTAAYQRYVASSSFPYALRLEENPEDLRVYLEGLLDTIMVRNIVGLYRLADTAALECVLGLTMNSAGRLLSMRRIAGALCSMGMPLNVRTAEHYMRALVESFLLYRAGRYDVRSREHLRTQEKFYCADPGLRRVFAGPLSWDDDSTLENVIYLELLRRGFKVYVGKWNTLEIDFVAMEPGSVHYFQVSASVRSSDVLARELKPLLGIRDSYPKTLLTLDEEPEENINGIRKVFELDWLMSLDQAR